MILFRLKNCSFESENQHKMETINITADIKDKSQMDALKAFLKALKIKFEIEKKEEKPYNPEFVAKIMESRAQYERGEFTRVKSEDLEDFLGLK